MLDFCLCGRGDPTIRWLHAFEVWHLAKIDFFFCSAKGFRRTQSTICWKSGPRSSSAVWKIWQYNRLIWSFAYFPTLMVKGKLIEVIKTSFWSLPQSVKWGWNNNKTTRHPCFVPQGATLSDTPTVAPPPVGHLPLFFPPHPLLCRVSPDLCRRVIILPVQR